MRTPLTPRPMAGDRTDPAAPSGLLVVDKPAGWTSHDVVARVRRLAATRKVGHAGTLDPMATGVLVLGLGAGTRLLTYLVGADKAYSATIRLGQATLTDDMEGDVVSAADASGLPEDRVNAAVRELTGPIRQRPSAVSAIKVDGRRAYARVRAGEQVQLEPRSVVVHGFRVLDRRPQPDLQVLDLDVEVDVSSGTYVRALARDLGAALGVGGHLTALRRTRVGAFGLPVACTLEELEHRVDVVPLARAARDQFPGRELTSEEVTALRYGQRLSPSGAGAAPVAGFGPEGDLVALLHDVAGAARSLFVVPAGPATSS
jgi:tRNA pseudouridine55 synthase